MKKAMHPLFLKTICFLMAWTIRLYFRLFIKTEIRGKQHWKMLRDRGKAVIHIFWHNDELIQPYFNKNSNLTVMISLSPDGEMLSHCLSHFDMRSVRGSSSRRSSGALKEMTALSCRGRDIAFATDGPRGPRHRVKPGAIISASTSGNPIIASACSASKKFIFRKSWDRGAFPLPFSRVVTMYSRPINIPQNLAREEILRETLRVEKLFLRLTENVENYFNVERRGFGPLRKLFFDFPGTRKILLLPIAALYSIIILGRNRLFDLNVLKQVGVKARVISIGNLTLGGTGKTPVTQYLIQRIRNLKGEDHRVAVVMRRFHDEAGMIGKASVPVVIHQKKWKGVLETESKYDPETIIVDDGFQHRYFLRDTNILLINAAQEFENNLLFPAGTLREPLSAIQRADIVIITRSNEIEYPMTHMKNEPPATPQIIAKIRQINPRCSIVESIFVPECGIDLTDRRVLLVSATANPKSFADHARDLGAIVKKQLVYPDHYSYEDTDYKYINSLRDHFDSVLTTEKDAAKMDRSKVEFHTVRIYFQVTKTHGKVSDLFN